MPFNTGPGCDLGSCDAPVFPVTAAACICETAVGGISELYFVPCTETMSEANVTDPDWWQGLITDNKLGRSGLGLGSIAAGNKTTRRKSSCKPEEITGITWNLTFQIVCVDKTSARTTSKKVNEMLNKSSKYLLLARMCDGEEEVLPVGSFAATDIDWTVPDNVDEDRVVQIVLSWKEKQLPDTVDVPGLSAVLPKAA